MPPATFDAFRNHGRPRPSLEEGVDEARETLALLARLGIDLEHVTARVLEDGVRLFAEAFDKLLAAVADAVSGPGVRGDRVVLSYVSADRDERAFDDPDGLDITRQPNDHVAFGAGGPHFCLGASLARIEARVMFEQILTRFEGLEPDGAPTLVIDDGNKIPSEK